MSNGIDEVLESIFGPKTDMDYNLEQMRENKKNLLKELVNFRKNEGLSKDEVSEKLGWKKEILEKFEKGELDSQTMDAHLEDYALAIGATINYAVEKFTRE